MKAIKKSALLLTSVSTDVRRSGGDVFIADLPKIRQNEIRQIKQIKYKAEVVQVTTVGNDTYTPTANTRYSVEIIDVEKRREGFTGQNRVFGWTTPPVLTTIGSTTALQREYIHGKIITAINLATSYVHGTAVTLGTGSGFTITDSTGYYPANDNGASGSRKGANTILAKTNADGTGFVASQVTVTTAPVYSFGDGTRLLADKPVMAAYWGVLTAGDLENPKTAAGLSAVAGQFYDAFIVSSLTIASAIGISGQYALVPQEFSVFVDNGTGSATTNLTGFLAFSREMRKLITSTYRKDPSSVIDFFGKPVLMQGALGAAPATTGTYRLLSEEVFQVTQIGTQTIVGPVINDAGLLLDQDLTDTEGAEYVPSILTNDARSFVVGKTPFSLYARMKAADCTDMGVMVGFRKKAAHAADYNDYTDLAGIGSVLAGDTISTYGILNNAATLITASVNVPADATSYSLEVLVDINGAVTAKYNGISRVIYSAGTTALILDAGDEMIPFMRAVNIGGGDPDSIISEFWAINDNSWKL
jgi:hypothetical protein